MRTSRLIDRLEAMLTLFNTKKKWCKGAMAKDEYNSSTEICSKDAMCFCLVGAARRVVKRPRDKDPIVEALAVTILSPVTIHYPNHTDPQTVVIDYNDAHGRRFGQVKSIIRKTLTRLQKNPA